MNPWAIGSEREAMLAAQERAAFMQQIIGMREQALKHIRQITGIDNAIFDQVFAQADDAIIRDMMGRWVSELPPCVVRGQNSGVLGLCVQGGDGAVLVRPSSRRGA
jgi:hypothetical protein